MPDFPNKSRLYTYTGFGVVTALDNFSTVTALDNFSTVTALDNFSVFKNFLNGSFVGVLLTRTLGESGFTGLVSSLILSSSLASGTGVACWTLAGSWKQKTRLVKICTLSAHRILKSRNVNCSRKIYNSFKGHSSGACLSAGKLNLCYACSVFVTLFIEIQIDNTLLIGFSLFNSKYYCCEQAIRSWRHQISRA